MKRRIRLPKPRTFVRGRGLPWTLFVLALGAAVTFAALWGAEKAEDDRQGEAAATARDFLLALTNFSAQTIEEDVREIRSFAIGEFASEVEDTFREEQIEAIRSNEATSQGEIQSVFVERLESDSATVFGVVNETVSNAASPTPRTDVLRVEVGLIETTNGWKVNRVDILQSPGGVLVP